jgi:XTP/dITP diphosphohydrolase
MKTLLIATRNQNKFAEIEKILKLSEFKLKSLNNFKDIPQIKENKDTFKGNAIKKARELSQITGLLSLSDDSGLQVDALAGKPGVYSSRFSGSGSNDQKNMEKLLLELKYVPEDRRSAQFVCWVALADKTNILATTSGVCKGKIAMEPFGDKGFGYDPVFIPAGFDKTFAELGIKLKNKISHRVKALNKMKEEILRLRSSKIL